MDIISKKIFIDKSELRDSVLNGFNVNNEMQIKDLKMKIEQHTGLIADEQALYCQGEILEDEKTLSDYMITNHSIINIIARLRGGMRIFVKAPNENIFAFTAESDDKIYHLKSKIEKLLGIKMRNQILSHENEILQDKKTLEQYGIVDKSMINIDIEPGMQIYVRRVDGKTDLIIVRKGDTIRDINLIIQQKIRLTADEFKLYYKGLRLKDERSVGHYGIAEKSVINFVAIRGMQIFAKTMDGKTVSIEVQKTEKISDIKKKIQEKIGLAAGEQKLIYQGGILEDERTVGHYGIAEKSVINVAIKEIKIYVIDSIQNKRVLFSVDNTDKIGSLKLKILEKFGLPPESSFNLMLNARHILDYQTFQECNVHYNDTLCIIHRTCGGGSVQQIFLLPSKREHILMHFDPAADINWIKERIEEKIGLAAASQEWLYQGDVNAEMREEMQCDAGPVFIVCERRVFRYRAGEFNIADIKLQIQLVRKLNKGDQKLIIHNKQRKEGQLLYQYSVLERSVFKKYSIMKKFCLLIEAIKKGSINNVKEYFKSYQSEIKHGSYSRSPLLYACKFGHRDIVEYFIDKKCKLDSSDCELRSALHYAVISKNNDIVKLLIDRGADINAPDSLQMAPLHLACKANNIEAARLLIESNCDMNGLDRLKRSPLKIAETGGFENVINLIKEYQMIREIAAEMQLKCMATCDHNFCYTSVLNKTFVMNKDIDSGSFGIVYLCTDSVSKRKFAVKKNIRKSEKSKYIEANINEFKEKLHHERILKYFGAYYKQFEHLIFMEFIDGGSLERKIKDKTQPPYDVISYTKQLLEALSFIHERSIIHRDIKPQNVLLDLTGNLKLADFGWSLLLTSVANEIQKTGTLCGTLCYMAPEIMNGELYSCSVDIWSLGATVIELCTGKQPYSTLPPFVAMNKIMTTRRIDYKLPPNMPPYMKNLIDKMLDPDQSHRASAAVLLDIVKSCL